MHLPAVHLTFPASRGEVVGGAHATCSLLVTPFRRMHDWGRPETFVNKVGKCINVVTVKTRVQEARARIHNRARPGRHMHSLPQSILATQQHEAPTLGHTCVLVGGTHVHTHTHTHTLCCPALKFVNTLLLLVHIDNRHAFSHYKPVQRSVSACTGAWQLRTHAPACGLCCGTPHAGSTTGHC
jgi:hypothetical protein